MVPENGSWKRFWVLEKVFDFLKCFRENFISCLRGSWFLKRVSGKDPDFLKDSWVSGNVPRILKRFWKHSQGLKRFLDSWKMS